MQLPIPKETLDFLIRFHAQGARRVVISTAHPLIAESQTFPQGPCNRVFVSGTDFFQTFQYDTKSLAPGAYQYYNGAWRKKRMPR